MRCRQTMPQWHGSGLSMGFPEQGDGSRAGNFFDPHGFEQVHQALIFSSDPVASMM